MQPHPTNSGQPILYLMLGYPGAGKTTAARVISQLTGAKHLWADAERRELFGTPTYSETENAQLYDRMNTEAAELLGAGTGVVFDTGFNKRADRDHLRSLAEQAGAKTQLIWVTVDPITARERATKDAHLQDSRALGNMTTGDFERLRNKLEPPQSDEPYTELDGTKITPDYVAKQLPVDSL